MQSKLSNLQHEIIELLACAPLATPLTPEAIWRHRGYAIRARGWSHDDVLRALEDLADRGIVERMPHNSPTTGYLLKSKS